MQSPSGDAAALRLIVVSIILAVGAVLVSEWIGWRVRRERRA
jgi:molybdate transport system permease protein